MTMPKGWKTEAKGTGRVGCQTVVWWLKGRKCHNHHVIGIGHEEFVCTVVECMSAKVQEHQLQISAEEKAIFSSMCPIDRDTLSAILQRNVNKLWRVSSFILGLYFDKVLAQGAFPAVFATHQVATYHTKGDTRKSTHINLFILTHTKKTAPHQLFEAAKSQRRIHTTEFQRTQFSTANGTGDTSSQKKERKKTRAMSTPPTPHRKKGKRRVRIQTP